MAAFKPQAVPDPLPQPAGKNGSAPVDFTIQNSSAPSSNFAPEEGGRFKQFYRNNKWYVWAIVLGVVIIGALAYFAFHKQDAEPTKDANVEISVEAKVF